MNKVITKILVMLGFMFLALPFVNAQTLTPLFESYFSELVPPLVTDGSTQGNATNPTSISLTDATLIIDQMGFGIYDGTTTAATSPPQAPANPTYPYFFRFTAAYTAGVSTKNYIDITPTKPFNNGGRITVMLSGTSATTNDAGSFMVVDKSNDATVLGTTNGSALKTAISECTIDLPSNFSGTKTIRLYRSGNSIYLHYIKIETYSSTSTPTITSFIVDGVTATIDNTNYTITAVLPAGTDLTSLTPAVTVAPDVDSYSPSGAQDFTGPVTYTVTDGTNSQDYTVNLTVASTPPPSTCQIDPSVGKDWNFSTPVFGTLPVAISLGDTLTLDCLNIIGTTSGTASSIVARTSGSYSQAVNFGGNASATLNTGRYFTFDVAGPASITVYYSPTGTTNPCTLVATDNAGYSESLSSDGTTALQTATFNYTGAGGTISLYVLNQNAYFYEIKVGQPSASTPSSDATLSSLTEDGTAIPLVSGQTDYTVNVPYGTTTVPTIAVTQTDPNATYVIKPATDLTGQTIIDVTAADGTTTATYTVNFNVLPQTSGNVTTWNFSDFALGDITAGFFNCLTITGVTSGTAVSIDANNKSMDGFSFTQRLKLGNAGSPATSTPNLPTVRYASFPVAGNAVITIYGESSSSNTPRTLVVTDGVNVIGNFTNDGNAIGKATISYTGPATTIYIYSLSGGFNIYAISVDGALGDCTPPAPSSDATLESLTVNGSAVPLAAGQTGYTVVLPYGTTAVPTIVPTLTNSNATVSAITYPTNLPGQATFTVTAADGSTANYTINFTVSTTPPVTCIPVDPAIGKDWNFSNTSVFGTAPIPITNGDTPIFDCLTIAGTAAGTSTASSIAARNSGSYSQAVNFGGANAGNLKGRYFSFDVAGPTAITVYWAQSSASATSTLVATDNAGYSESLNSDGTTALQTTTFNYTGTGGTIYLYVTTQNAYFYQIVVGHPSVPSIPSSDATLKSLTVNGNSVPLTAGKTDYTVNLPNGTTTVPKTTATTNDPNATVVITNACDLTWKTTIDVTAEDGTQIEYTVGFNMSPQTSGQSTMWNFSDFAQGDIAAGIFDCLTITGVTSGTAVSIDANSKSMDGYSFTQRLKLGGAGSPATNTPYLPTVRYVSFPVAGNAVITIYGMSSSSGTSRTLEITDGVNEIGTFTNDGTAIDKATISYTGSATTIYMYSLSSGFNIYAIGVDGALGSCSPSAPGSDATLKSLTANGNSVSLSAGQTAYTVDLPYGTTAVPTIVATPNDSKATVVITNAANLGGQTIIDVTAEDGTKMQYTVSFNVLPQTTEQNTIWNFSESPFVIGDIEGTVNGLTISGATSGTAVTIDANSKSMDDYSFTQRLKLGGAGSPDTETPNLPTQRYLSFDVTGNTTVTIYGMSSSSNTERTLVVTDGVNVIGNFTNDGNSIDKVIINYTGPATTLYIYSLSSGFNIYAILADGNIALSIKNVMSDKEVKSVSYYDLLGRPVPDAATGIIIVKTIYKDGSSTNIKVYRQRK